VTHSSFTTPLAHLRAWCRGHSAESDAELLRRFVRHRDGIAFEQLVDRHSSLVWGVCRRILPSEADCEDAFQATFLALVRQAPSLASSRPLDAWLHTVAVRAARKAHVRALRRPPQRSARDRQTMGDIADGVAARELLGIVDAEIEQLPAVLRAPLVLCCLEGRTRDEAAAAIGCSVAAVKSRLERGRERLRRRLSRRGIELPAAFLVLSLTGGRVRASLRAQALQSALGVAPTSVAALVPVTTSIASRVVATAASLAMAGTIGLALLVGAEPRQQAASPSETPPMAVARGRKTGPPADPSKAVIEGVVNDETGKPVASVTVRVPGQPTAMATTTGDGRFRLTLEGPLAKYTTVHARTADGSKLAVGRTDSTDDSAMVPVRLILKPAATIRVRVVDSKGGQVSDAPVAAIISEGPAIASGRTDAAGAAELLVPADSEVHQVVALKGGVGLDYFENYRVPYGGEKLPPPREVRLVLDGSHPMPLKAADETGKPVAGAEVVPIIVWKRDKIDCIQCGNWDWLGDQRIITDTQGSATCTWVPAALQRSACFNLNAPGYRCINVPYFHLDGKVEPEVTPLVRGVEVGGQVTRPDGSPAAGVLIIADGRHVRSGPTSTGGYYVARTTVDGSYHMSLPPGSGYVLSVHDADWAAGRTSATVNAAGPSPDFDLRLTPGTLIAGRVTAGERPSKGETMYLKQLAPPPPGQDAHPRPWLIRWAKTDDEGRYRFRVMPGDYQLAGPDMKFVDVKVGTEQTLACDFKLQHLPRVPFEAVIRKPDGSPAGSVIVPWNGMSAVRTDDRGRVQTVRNREPMLFYALDPVAKLAAFIILGADDESAALTLRPATIARGRVVGRDGLPRNNCTITAVIRSPMNLDPGLWVTVSAYSGPDGSFTLPPLAEGTTCSLIVCNGMTCGITPAKEFEVTGSKPIDLGDLAAPKDSK
jgi:RNA polymerase sigma factor (sigma-70 family)